MNEPYPPGQQKKKGLHPLAWVAIGCAGLLIIAAILVTAGGIFVSKKVGDIASDFEDNPAMAAAQFIVRMDPNLELVESDEAAGTITIRNEKTGEVVTVNLEDVQEGRFGWTNEDGATTSFTMAEGSAGGMEVTTQNSDGTTSEMTLGGGADDSDIPYWVPRYPGAEVASAFATSTNNKVSGIFAQRMNASLEEAEQYYTSELEDLGSTVERSTVSAGGQKIINLKAQGNGRTLTVTLLRQNGEDLTTASITYEGEG
ncbi:MAG: hypothetical protein AAF481_03370 [Acidobacteriota bacterium]